MNRITKYTTAQDTDLRGLDKRVNNLIEMGYQPYGSPYSAFNGRSATLCQALVKFEGDEQDDTKSALAKDQKNDSLTPKPAGLKPSLSPSPKPAFAPRPAAPSPALTKPERAPALKPAAPPPALPKPERATTPAAPQPVAPIAAPSSPPPAPAPAPALPTNPDDDQQEPPTVIVEPLD